MFWCLASGIKWSMVGPADHTSGRDQAAGDNNQNGASDSRARGGREGRAGRRTWRQPLLVQLAAPHPLSHQFCSLSGNVGSRYFY